MNRFDKYRGHGLKSTRATTKENELVTRSGLAYTPADMERLTAHGIPVHQNDINTKFYDGDDKSDFFVTSDRIRSNDINDMWEEHQNIVSRAKKAHMASKAKKND